MLRKLFTVLMVCLALTTVSGIVYNVISVNSLPKQVVVVRSGDTLWTIASRWAEEGEDVRTMVYRIQRVNDMEGNKLQPGQKILVPARTHGQRLSYKF